MKIILNNLWGLISIAKMVILVISLYTFSQVYQGYLLTVIGVLGILWCMKDVLDAWNLHTIEMRLEKLEEAEK